MYNKIEYRLYIIINTIYIEHFQQCLKVQRDYILSSCNLIYRSGNNALASICNVFILRTDRSSDPYKFLEIQLRT